MLEPIKYTDFNEALDEEEMALFSAFLFRLVRYSEGGLSGRLSMVHEETGQKMELHFEAHDSILCEMHHLDELDKTIGRTIQ